MKKVLLILLLILSTFSIFSSAAYAWTSYTHQWICEKAGLGDLDCKSADYPEVQSQHPDLRPVNHHCTNDLDTCNARVYARKFLAINTSESRGFAAHLFADSMTPAHWYSLDYYSCHKIFEDKVEEKLKQSENIRYNLLGSKFDFSSWNISMECVDSKNKTVQLYADNNYMNQVVKYVAGEMHSSYVAEDVKDYNLDSVFYVFVVVIVIVFMLFLYFGLRNKKESNN